MNDETPLAADRLTVPVTLPGARYDILIGPVLAEAGAAIAALGPRQAAIVTDENVAKLYLPAVEASLIAAGIKVAPVVVPPGERSKSFAALERLLDALLDAKIERGDVVVALGGGVVGDLAGFAAAILRRGVRVVQIATTLLAQVDSSVGGKTGIDTRQGKNLVGAFHQPALVLADTQVLDTLPPREFRAGYAEVVKYGVIADAPFFAWLEDNRRAVFAGGAARTRAIATSCAAKAGVVQRDERETGERALLNLGHTFGHALESAVGYEGGRLIHGEGVAIGMVLALAFSAELGLAPATDAERLAAHLAGAGLPTAIADIPGERPSADRLLDLMAQDKKVKGGRLTFILARGIGAAFVANDVPADAVRRFLVRTLDRPQ
ncbi:MAG TPA: 3-dehydroquinate synthase [Hyphomicrobiales bacterium]|nr:3-dehydroquinate synthase [Hyphomicrobiales bacterium]